MQEAAIPYRTWFPRMPFHKSQILLGTQNATTVNGRKWSGREKTVGYLKKMVEENAVVVLAIKGCCMGHVVKRLLQTLGANPTVYEAEEEEQEETRLALRLYFQEEEMDHLLNLPTVFVGGRWFGGLDRVIGAHISGELTPLLKLAGALWL